MHSITAAQPTQSGGHTMTITINTTRPLVNGRDLQELLAQIVADYVTPDGRGAYILPEDARFGITQSGYRVGQLATDAETIITITP